MRKVVQVLGCGNHKKIIASMLLVAIAVLSLAAPMFSQTANGRISGTVKDQTGGAIVGAAVVVTDTARGLARNLTTDEAGAYLAPNLIPGNYTVRATFTGFQAFERTNIALGVGQDLFIDVVLQPGAQTQTITITEELPLVNTTSATLGGTLNNQTINDLPISGRNYVNLLELRPGTVLDLGNNSNGGGSASTNGLRAESSNSYAIEGLSGIDPYTGQSVTNLIGVNGDAATLLPLDAIQEFNQQFNSKAEYGSKAGSNVAVGLKSGTNALHGTAYGFFRDTATDALNYFNPYDTVGGVKTPIDIGGAQRQWGATAGGPIKKDKLFFFAGYEQMHLNVGSPRSIDAFFTDPAMLSNYPACIATNNCAIKQGLFPIQGKNPDASNHVILACQAMKNAGNNLSAQSLAMLGMNANCDLPGGTSVSSGAYAAGTVNPDFFVSHGANDHGAQGPSNGTITTFFPNNNTTVLALGSVAKLDYTVNEKNSINGFYYQGYGERFDGLGAQPSDRYRTQFLQYAKMVAGTWTWLPNSVVANSFRIGFASLNEPDYGLDDLQGFTAGQLGMNTGVTRPTALGVSQSFSLSGFYAIGSRQSDLQGPGRSYEISDALSYLLGKHSFKFGGSMIRDGQDIAISAMDKGTWSWGQGGSNTAAASGLVALLGGQALVPASVGGVALAGSGSTGLQSANLLFGDPFAHATRTNFAMFVQDDYRIRPRLTLNLGLRYDFSTPLRSHNGVLGNFDPNLPGGIAQEGINTDHIFNSNTKNFAPRVGFAWDVFGNGKTVIRGGGSLVYDLITLRTYLEVGNDQGLAGVPSGFVTGCTTTVGAIGANLNNCIGGQLTTPGGSRKVGSVAWSDGNANILGNVLWESSPITVSTVATGRANASQTIFPDPSNVLLNCNPLIQTRDTPTSTPRNGSTCGIPAIARDIEAPYVETWTLGIQHAIINNVLLDVAYVGNHGVNLLDKRNLNQAPTFSGWTSPGGQVLLQNCITNAINNASTCRKADSLVSSTTNGTLKPYFAHFPWMGDITQVVNGDTSNYDGLQATLTVRNYHGLSMVSGYTWAHALSVADNNNGGFGTDAYIQSLDYGAAGSDLRHRFSLAPTYQIPGHAGMHGLLEGWKLNGSFRFQTGRPLSYTMTGSGNADFQGTNRLTARWDLTGDASDFSIDPAPTNGVRNPNLAQYYPGCGTSKVTDAPCANLVYTSAANKTAAAVNKFASDFNARTGALFTAADMAVNNPACVAAAGPSANKQAVLRAYGCWVEGNSVLTPPALGTFGNSTKNQFRGLDFWQVDTSIAKRQKITERFSAEFRAEFYNLLNHPNFAQPSGAIGTSCTFAGCAFQTITATPDVSATNPIIGTGGPRRMQFGVKILF
jgi:hypothetical protein